MEKMFLTGRMMALYVSVPLNNKAKWGKEHTQAFYASMNICSVSLVK